MSSSPQLSLVSKQEAAAELLKRRNARASLHDFIQYINPEYITSKFSQTVCDALDQFLLDMMSGLRPILILGAPPQHGKSDIVSRYLPAYFFGKYPEMRVGALSYSADLAGDMNADVQRIMSTPEYRNIFPDAWLGNNPVSAGGTLIVGYWNAAGETLPATSGLLRGGEISQAVILPALREKSDWSFSIEIDGTKHDVTAINGMTAATLADVIAQIQTKITSAVASVVFDGSRIVITSKSTGANSVVGFSKAIAGGSFIGDLLAIAEGSGASQTNGSASTEVSPETQLESLSKLKAQVNVKGAAFIDKILDAQVPLIASWAKANAVIVYETFTGSAALEVDPSNPAWAVTLASQSNFRMLYSKAGNRKFGVSYMARTHTVNFNGERTAITLHLKTMNVPAESYEQTEIDKAKRVGLDIYTTIKDVPCVLSSGANDFVDNVYNLMAYVDAVQTDSFNLLKTTPTKVPQTYYGVDQLEDCVEKTTVGFVRAGVFNPGAWTLPDFFGDREMFLRNIEQNGYYVLAGDLKDQSTADRQERKSPVVQVAVKNAGAVHSADIIINFNK